MIIKSVVLIKEITEKRPGIFGFQGFFLPSLDYGNGDKVQYTYDQHGRQLASLTEGATTWNYIYNSAGLRTGRTDGTTSYTYVYDGSRLMVAQKDDVLMRMSYDTTGPLSLIYNGATYRYEVNIQGDVIALLDTEGNVVVEYTYDAWGNPLTITGDLADTVGVNNPLRYRGYVYDSETGLYYLQSRYYNPELGRFINSDTIGYLGVGSNLTSYNLFAYCGNNPVMGYDPTGHWDWGWEEQAALGTTVLIVGLALILAAPTGGSSLAFGALALSSSTVVTAGGAMAITGTIMVGDAVAQATVNYAKQSKKSDKERATDKPSWVSESDVDLGKSSQQNATDLLNNKYGSGNWGKGPRSEFNKIVKWINRGLKVVTFIMAEVLMED